MSKKFVDFTIQSLYTQKDRGCPAGIGHCTVARHKGPFSLPVSPLLFSHLYLQDCSSHIFIYIDIYTTFTKKPQRIWQKLDGNWQKQQVGRKPSSGRVLIYGIITPTATSAGCKGLPCEEWGGGNEIPTPASGREVSARLDPGLAMRGGKMKWEGNFLHLKSLACKEQTAFQKVFQKGDRCSCMEFLVLYCTRSH